MTTSSKSTVVSLADRREAEEVSVFTPAIVRQIAKDHQIPEEKTGRLRIALNEAEFNFLHEAMRRFLRPRSIPNAKKLYRYLCLALAELERPGMTERLHEAGRGLPRRRSAVLLDDAKSAFRLTLEIRACLPLIEAAMKLSGRKLRQQGRREVQAAKDILFAFWTTECGRSRSLYSRGRLSKAMNFLLECLHHLDDTLTEASLRDRPAK